MSESLSPTPPSEVVGIASTASKRRINALEQIPNLKLYSIPGGDEAEADVVEVAQEKNKHVSGILHTKLEKIYTGETEMMNRASNVLVPSLISLINTLADEPQVLELLLDVIKHDKSYKVIGADSQTWTLERRGDRNERFSHGKPKNREELQETIYNMTKTDQAVYSVMTGSSVDSYMNGDLFPTTTIGRSLVGVRLNKEMLQNLTTDSGLDRYLQAFHDFYAQDFHNGVDKEGNYRVTQFTDLSAGLSLPVFVKEGMVEALKLNSGSETHPSEVPEKLLKEIIFGVATGYAPKVLEQVVPGSYDFIIQNWGWLGEMAKDLKKSIDARKKK